MQKNLECHLPAKMRCFAKEHNCHEHCDGSSQGLKESYKYRPLLLQTPSNNAAPDHSPHNCLNWSQSSVSTEKIENLNFLRNFTSIIIKELCSAEVQALSKVTQNIKLIIWNVMNKKECQTWNNWLAVSPYRIYDSSPLNARLEFPSTWISFYYYRYNCTLDSPKEAGEKD